MGPSPRRKLFLHYEGDTSSHAFAHQLDLLGEEAVEVARDSEIPFGQYRFRRCIVVQSIPGLSVPFMILGSALVQKSAVLLLIKCGATIKAADVLDKLDMEVLARAG